MTYVLDTSMISALHRNYFPQRFPSLWRRLDQLTASGGWSSTREAFRELEDIGVPAAEWAKRNESLFFVPNSAEGTLVTAIYKVPHFLANIEKQKVLHGGKNADPFLVGRARAIGGCVVTMETLRPNAAKIPNICQHFSVPCLHLEKFMEQEGWTF